jgi:multiple sugar transport system permease protein
MKFGIHARQERRWALFFLSPWLFGFLVFTLGPMAASLFFSFTRFTLPDAPVFVGFENFAKLFADDPRFLNSLGITFLYAIVTVPVGLALGFFLAYFLNMKMPLARFWRTLYYMPAVVTPVITGTLFVGLFNGRFGLVNYLIERILGVKGPEWLLDPNYAIYAVMLISLWGVGGGMIIYLSGLQSIPTELNEAADLDGCSRGRRLRSITIPLMSPIIFYNLVVGIISTFQLFTQVYVLTKGGPGNSTEVYNIYLYTTAFQYQKMGYASAQAWVLFVLILAMTALVFKSSSAWVHYENEVKS